MCLVIPVESRRLRCSQGLPGASQCLFGDPEEICRLNAHKVSQVTLYVSGDPGGVPKATMPTRSPSVCLVIPVESRRL